MNYFETRNYHDKQIRRIQAQLDAKLVERETLDCEIDALARQLESEREAYALLLVDRDLIPVARPVSFEAIETV